MPDNIISNIQLNGESYKLKDSYARERMIDNQSNSDISAILNFLNGLKVNNKSVITDIEASITLIETIDPSVEVVVSPTGIASFSFKIPKTKSSSIDAVYVDNAVVFTNNNDYSAEFVNNSFYLTKLT